MQGRNITLSVLLLREDKGWVAQCLEYDIAAQGKSIKNAKKAFLETVAGQILLDIHHDREPLKDFKEAPPMYRQMFDNAERLADKEPIQLPHMPPAFVISALADDLRVYA